MAKHVAREEWWIEAAAQTNRGWTPAPRHAHGGRHASQTTRRGRRVLARVFGVTPGVIRAWAWSDARRAAGVIA